MEIAIGQRWQCFSPKAIVEVKRIVESGHIIGIVVNGESYRAYDDNWYSLPTDGSDHNRTWQYLHGQDKPL